MIKIIKNMKALLAFCGLLFLGSCAKAPTACQCKETLGLVVNYEQMQTSAYKGQFNKEVYEACIDQYKKDNNAKGEALIKAVYLSYEDACVE